MLQHTVVVCAGEFCGQFIGSELCMRPNVLDVPNGNGLVLRLYVML